MLLRDFFIITVITGPGGAAIETPSVRPIKMKEPASNADFSYFKGLFTGILNPMQIGWWLTAGLSIIEDYIKNVTVRVKAFKKIRYLQL